MKGVNDGSHCSREAFAEVTRERIAALAAQEVTPHLQRVGTTLRDAGTAPAYVIGDGEHPWWDAILVVEYPTPQAFLDMVRPPEYTKVHEHRVAGLEHGDLIGTSAWPLAANAR